MMVKAINTVIANFIFFVLKDEGKYLLVVNKKTVFKRMVSFLILGAPKAC